MLGGRLLACNDAHRLRRAFCLIVTFGRRHDRWVRSPEALNGVLIVQILHAHKREQIRVLTYQVIPDGRDSPRRSTRDARNQVGFTV